MAHIQPLRAWRYHRRLTPQIDSLTSPLFDVVSARQRENLYKNPLNSIHLSVPVGDDAMNGAARKLATWKGEHVLEQDALPGIYGYYQYFSLPGSGREFCRKGFICHIKAYDWSEKVVLRHENTIPGAVSDRQELLEKTLLHVSPTHGLYTDPEFRLEAYLDESMQAPLYETEDYQGVRDVLSVIHDARVIREFVQLLSDQVVILADGHHRYESSIAHRHAMQALTPNATGTESWNYHLMLLTNTEADDLVVLPTHRLINGLANFSGSELLEKLEPYFLIKPLEDAYTAEEIIMGKKWAFGVLLADGAYKIRLRPEVFDQLAWAFPEEVKQLDLTVLHYFVIEKALGIAGKEQRRSDHISFSRSFSECLTKVLQGDAQVAFITQGVSMDEIKQVCQTGYTMPQKSTYFYPKAVCGLLFSSIHPDEFAHPACISF